MFLVCVEGCFVFLASGGGCSVSLVSLSVNIFTIHATPDTTIEGSKDITAKGPVLIADPLPINSEYKNKIAMQCKYNVSMQKRVNDPP